MSSENLRGRFCAANQFFADAEGDQADAVDDDTEESRRRRPAG